MCPIRPRQAVEYIWSPASKIAQRTARRSESHRGSTSIPPFLPTLPTQGRGWGWCPARRGSSSTLDNCALVGHLFGHRPGVPHRQGGPHRGQLPARRRDGVGGGARGVRHAVRGCHRDAQGPHRGGGHRFLQGHPLLYCMALASNPHTPNFTTRTTGWPGLCSRCWLAGSGGVGLLQKSQLGGRGGMYV